MKPTVPELLAGMADALEADVAGHVDDQFARNQVQAAIAMLRRLAPVVSKLTAYLLADSADLAMTLTTVAPAVDDPVWGTDATAAVAALAAFDPAHDSLDLLHDLHNRLLGLIDQLVTARADGALSSGDGTVAQAVRALLERTVARERALGASIAGR